MSGVSNITPAVTATSAATTVHSSVRQLTLTADTIQQSIPEDVLTYYGGAKKLARLPVREYFFYEKEGCEKTRARDKALVNSSPSQQIWLEAGTAQDLEESNRNFALRISNKEPMVTIAVRQKMSAIPRKEQTDFIHANFPAGILRMYDLCAKISGVSVQVFDNMDVVLRYSFAGKGQEVLFRANFYNPPAGVEYSYLNLQKTQAGYKIEELVGDEALVNASIVDTTMTVSTSATATAAAAVKETIKHDGTAKK